MIQREDIDGGRSFDFGRTSDDYARYRDIYPAIFYQKIADRFMCVSGQKVLDIGTGTGVLPRNMYRFGALWTGVDISEEQIRKAKECADRDRMNIRFLVSSAEDICFPDESFDIVTACQCFFYFNTETLMPVLYRILKPGGKLIILYMAWLPEEDEIAKRSEALALKYNPFWSGAGEKEHPIRLDENVLRYFSLTDSETYRVKVPFTRESWHGRMKTCRGIGASLSPKDFFAWDREHLLMLEREFPESFEVLHYVSTAVLERKSLDI